jgi:hypothetical protein
MKLVMLLHMVDKLLFAAHIQTNVSHKQVVAIPVRQQDLFVCNCGYRVDVQGYGASHGVL